MREGPSGDSPLIRILSQGERVDKIGSSGNFFQIRTEQGEEGFIYGSYLKRITGKAGRVPGFDEFAADLERGPGARASTGPERYFFESVLEFLRIENHPFYVILLPILVAIAVGVAGVVMLKESWGLTDRVLPMQLAGPRRTAVRVMAVVALAYAVIETAVYFLDLSLHYAALEENTVLVLVLAVPRMALAGPVAVVDALAGNWIAGITALLIMALIAWPGFKGAGPPADSEADYDTIPSFSVRTGKASHLPEQESKEHKVGEEDEGPVGAAGDSGADGDGGASGDLNPDADARAGKEDGGPVDKNS
jgi:hypothetical protein